MENILMIMLYNRISNQVLRNNMLITNEKRITISFYCYFQINEPQIFRNILYQKLITLKVLGRIYIAREGINAQISIPQKYFYNLKEILYNYPPLEGMLFNIALEDNGKSFWVLHMKVRKYIVADGINDPTFNLANVGQYLNAKEVNLLSDDPNVLFIDMRNYYEYEVGHFYNAIEIPSNTFREQLLMVINMLQHNKNKHIVIYCTGGIRCEKASAWMLHHGFKNISHIKGGIIEYVRQARIQKLPLKFIGKNFVFDARLGERITPEIIAHCHQCNKLCDRHTNCYNNKCHILFIQCFSCFEQYQGCCSKKCQKINHA